jgi:hypothetical protein
MGRRNHYFPVSSQLNDDPEVWILTEQFGDRSLRVMLEIYRILHHNFNHFPDTEEVWKGVFNKCRIRLATGWLVRGYCLASGWLRVHKPLANDLKTSLGSPNYWKYHTNECKESDWSWDDYPPLLTKPNQTGSSYKNTQIPDSPSAGFDKSEKKRGDNYMAYSMGLSPELKEQSDRLYLSDKIKFQKLAAWIGQGRKHGYFESDMAEALSQFWEYRFIDDWYPYLDQILDKVVKNRNAGEHDLETERLRQEAREFTEGKPALALVRGLGQAKGMK